MSPRSLQDAWGQILSSSWFWRNAQNLNRPPQKWSMTRTNYASRAFFQMFQINSGLCFRWESKIDIQVKVEMLKIGSNLELAEATTSQAQRTAKDLYGVKCSPMNKDSKLSWRQRRQRSFWITVSPRKVGLHGEGHKPHTFLFSQKRLRNNEFGK